MRERGGGTNGEWRDRGGEGLDHGGECQGDNEGKMGKVEKRGGGIVKMVKKRHDKRMSKGCPSKRQWMLGRRLRDAIG
jgi:hypothetical protein